MPNVLPLHVRVRVVGALVEGTSIRATARQTHTNKDAVMHLALKVGLGCIKLHNKLVTDVHSHYLEVDEVWAYVGIHEKRKTKKHPPHYGDTYTFFAIDSVSKVVPAYATGKRTLPMATRFMADLHTRVKGKPQISVDGWPHWVESVRRTFGYRGAHLGAVVKEYQKTWGVPQVGAGSYGRVKSEEKTVLYGNPEMEFVSTAIAERLNLTTRMTQRRLTRLTNAFSRKVTSLRAAVGLHFFHYNFVRRHESIKTTPAVKAGLAKHEWTLEEMVKAALEQMGEDFPEPGARPRRYQRKTHRLVAMPGVQGG